MQAEEQERASQPGDLQGGAGRSGRPEPQIASLLQQNIALGHQPISAGPCCAASNGVEPFRLTASQAAIASNKDGASASAPAHAAETSWSSICSGTDAAGSQPDVSSQPSVHSDGACPAGSDSEPESNGSLLGDLESQDPFAAGEREAAIPSEVITVASPITCVTADFAMQNVLLQMGLQLQAPNGLRLKRVSRFVQRCSACFFIVKVTFKRQSFTTC